MNCNKSLSNITFFDDGLGTHIEEGEVECETLFVNGVQITTNGGGGGSVPSISYVAGSPSVTTISGNTVINNLNGFTSANFTNALNQTVSLTSPAQTQLNGLTTKTANMTGTGSTTLFAGTLTLNSNTTLVTNKTMTVNGAFSFGANGQIISNGVTLTNVQIGYLQATSPIQTQFNALQFKTTNQNFNSTLNRTAISGICLLENLNLSGTINSRLINVGTDVSPSLINLNGDLTIPSASTITANGVVISATELSYLDNASSNIQTQINNANSAIGNNTTSISNINTEIGPIIGIITGTINQRIFDTAAVASSALAAAGVADGLAVAAGGVAAAAGTAAVAAQTSATTANNRCTTLEEKTTKQTFFPAGSGQPDRTIFDSDVIANRLRSNELLPDTGSSVDFNITGTSKFSGSILIEGSLSTTGSSTTTGTSTNNGASVLNGAVGINGVTSFNGKSTTFLEEIPAFPASTKAIVTFNQPALFYKPVEIYSNVTMEQNRTLFCNKIIANPLMVGVDEIQINSGLSVGTENFKMSSNMVIDALYTLTNNGTTALLGDVGIGGVALNKNLTIACDDINSFAISALYDANVMNIGTQANCGSCEIATNTSINLRTNVLSLIAPTTNIDSDVTINPVKILSANKIIAGVQAGTDILQLNSASTAGVELLKISSNTEIDPLYTLSAKGNVVIGDSTQTGAVESFTSYSEFQLKSAITFYENITSAYKDAIIYATKTVGATVNFIGTLNFFARNYIYTNINNIYYRTSTVSGFNDVTTTISTINAAVQNGGRLLQQAYQYDVESPTFNIGTANTVNFNLTGENLNLGDAVNCDNINLISGLTTDIESTLINIKALSLTFGDAASPLTHQSNFNSFLSSNYVFVLNEVPIDAVTNPYRNALMYGKKLAGAAAHGIGSLFAVARNFTFSNIQNVFYKSLDTNGLNDVTTVITAGAVTNNTGQIKTQASVIDLEAPTVYLGKDANSIVNFRGIIQQF